MPFPIPISLSKYLTNFSLVQIPTPIPNKKTTPKGGLLVCSEWRDYFVHCAHQPDGWPRYFPPVSLSLVVVLLKFTLFVFEFANLSFGHSVAIFSLCGAVACLLKSNLRPSLKISPPEIFFASGSFSLVQIPTPIPNKKNHPKGWFSRLVGVTGFDPATSTSRT